MKRLPSNQPSIEPTQVAGFNQVFDDLAQTRFVRYGAAVDQSWAQRVFAGVEFTRRNLDVPVFATFVEDRTEELHRAYASWLVTPRLSAGAEFLFERIERKNIPPGNPFFVPVIVETPSLPLTMTYHHPSGIFGLARMTFVRQEIESRNDVGDVERRIEHFSVFDMALGWRLPRRHGVVSVEVKNLFDEKFTYRDTTFEGFPRVPQFAPERAAYVRLQLNL